MVQGCCGKITYGPEPLIFFYVLALLLHTPVLQQYGYHRYSKEYHLDYSPSSNSNCNGTEFANSSKAHLQDKVQSLTSQFQIGFMLCETIPSVIVCLFYGPLSDRIGRKPIFMISLMASSFECIAVLVTMGFNLPLPYIFIGSFLNGVGGYYTAITFAAVAYIADITTPENRTVRLGTLAGIVLLAGIISCSCSGILITSLGYMGAYWFVFGSMLISLLYTTFLLTESLDKNNENQQEHGNWILYPAVSLKVFFKKRPGQWKIFIITTAELLMYVLNMSLLPVISLYTLNRPFCLSSLLIGLFLASRYFIMGIGVILGIKLFSLCLPKHWIAIIGIVSGYAMLTVFALATTPFQLFLAWFAGIFCMLSEPVYRGILSNSISPHDQGKFFSVVSSLEIFIIFLGNLFFNKLYIIGNGHGFPQLLFYGAMALLCIPLVLTIFYCLSVTKLKPFDENNETKPLLVDHGVGNLSYDSD